MKVVMNCNNSRCNLVQLCDLITKICLFKNLRFCLGKNHIRNQVWSLSKLLLKTKLIGLESIIVNKNWLDWVLETTINNQNIFRLIKLFPHISCRKQVKLLKTMVNLIKMIRCFTIQPIIVVSRLLWSKLVSSTEILQPL